MRVLLLALVAVVSSSASAREPKAAADIYMNVCAKCHEARVGPPLLGRGLTAPVIQTFVRTGVNGMPAFRKTEISDQELAALARFIETKEATK